jgi:hypothetical protein
VIAWYGVRFLPEVGPSVELVVGRPRRTSSTRAFRRTRTARSRATCRS